MRSTLVPKQQEQRGQKEILKSKAAVTAFKKSVRSKGYGVQGVPCPGVLIGQIREGIPLFEIGRLENAVGKREYRISGLHPCVHVRRRCKQNESESRQRGRSHLLSADHESGNDRR